MAFYILVAGQLVLLLIFVAIVYKVTAMVRAGAPLLALGKWQWQLAPQSLHPSPKPKPEAKPKGQIFSRLKEWRATRKSARDLPEPEQPERTRTRRLVSASESLQLAAHQIAAPGAPPEDVLPGLAVTVEARVTTALDTYCSNGIQLAPFSAAIEDISAWLDTAIAQGSHDPQDRENALQTLDWCRDWILKQL